MISIDDLYAQKRKYVNLREKVTNTRNDLKSAIDKISGVSDKIINGYSVDDVSADNGRLKKIENEIRDMHDNLSNVILPNINSKIKKLESDIEIAESLENG